MPATALKSPAPLSPATSASWLDDDTLRAVRPHVKHLLEASPGFKQLAADQQRELARTMVKVAAYMANPDGLAKEELTPGKGLLAKAQADAVDDAKRKASAEVGRFAGADFQGGAMREGVQAFKDLVGSVDFPTFVGGLIQNVFQAIVTASIQQMNAYASLLKSVAQTVDEFAQDNITANNGRDWLAGKYPDQLSIDTSESDDGGQPVPKLTINENADAEALHKQMSDDLQLANPVTDISDAGQEASLVQAARMQMARSRQQLLSSMVLLGINRIVVTDGAINAKVVFDLKASDQAQRRAQASLYDRQSSFNENVSAIGGGFLGWGGGSVNTNRQEHVTTVSSAVDESSESKAEIKAKLSGEVRVNFKSDYFPMEKLASPGMIAAIQGNAKPVDPNVVPSAQRGSAGTAPAAATQPPRGA